MKLGYTDFDAFWVAQTPSYSPTTRIIEALSDREREELMVRVRAALPRREDGRIQYEVVANAVKARVSSKVSI